MDPTFRRRDFLAAAVAVSPLSQSAPAQTVSAVTETKTTPYRKVVLEAFDYSGVTLRPSM
jgi:hypothetical protein